MSEMKMSDVFYTDDFNIMHQAEIVDTSKYAYIEHNEIQIEGESHINHAVRNHDRMAEEIAELKGALKSLIGKGIDLLNVEDVIDEEDAASVHSNFNDAIIKSEQLLAKLNQEGEE